MSAQPPQWIRISCASLCRIAHGNRFLLLLNQNRRQKGIYILSPIGGALTIEDRSCLDAFGVMPEDKNSADLRLTLPLDRLPEFRDWFYRRQCREISPYRELHEELVLENDLLPALEQTDVEWELLWTVEERTFTERQGQTGMLTHYFLEIYGVRFKTHAALGALLAAPPDSGAAWVTLEQIVDRSTISLSVDGETREAKINGTLLVHPPANRPWESE